jgi:hypothetical protein
MLIGLPIVTFIAVFALILGSNHENEFSPLDKREAFLKASLVVGSLVIILTEGLSFFNAISPLWMTFAWGLVLVSLLWFGWRRDSFKRIWEKIRKTQWQSIGWVDGLLLCGLAVITIILWLVAFKSPPNTTDSLQYHMSRVAHWIQNENLNHYPTAYEPQLMHPIWSEMAILNLNQLWGSDRLANMVQWTSMMGSLVGVSAVAALLGARRRDQLLAIAYAISIPIGILQSTSTQNDYVTAFWLICLIYFILKGERRALKIDGLLSISLALGLGILTKATFYAYALPFLAWFFLMRLRGSKILSAVKEGLLIFGVAAFLNLGFWTRNIATYGGPLGSSVWLERHTTIQFGPASILSSWVRDIALNLPTPSEHVNKELIRFVESLHEFLGTDPQGFSLVWSWNHEDLAGNPLHLFLLVLTLITLAVLSKRARVPLLFRYAFFTVSSFLVLSPILDFDLYGVRYQLPLFILWAPLIGALSSQLLRPRASSFGIALFLLISLPWVLLNRSRPVIGLRPRTMIESIFKEPEVDVLFANWIVQRDSFVMVTEAIKTSECTEVGLRIDSGDLEYPYWWLLGAPQNGIRIETIDPYPHLYRYVDASFKPCAIVCSLCGGRTRFHGLPRQGKYGKFSLFLGPGYTSNEDG